MGVNMKQLRMSKMLSQTDLAKMCYLSRCQINRIERGVAKPSIETAKVLGSVLGFPWYEIFE